VNAKILSSQSFGRSSERVKEVNHAFGFLHHPPAKARDFPALRHLPSPQKSRHALGFIIVVIFNSLRERNLTARGPPAVGVLLTAKKKAAISRPYRVKSLLENLNSSLELVDSAAPNLQVLNWAASH